MEYKKGMMRNYLFENLRSLMGKKPFEKITIKQICDETGVIRATFYNYFDDKYDCLYTIVYHDFVETSLNEIKTGDTKAIFMHMLESAKNNRNFYSLAYRVEGQNSFEDMVTRVIAEIIEMLLRNYRKKDFMQSISNDLLIRYYSRCIGYALRSYVLEVNDISDEDAWKLVEALMSHSLNDFLDNTKTK